jgi:tetratricopeptide (TPR) repeat protein
MKPAFVILAVTLVLAGCQTNLPPPVKGDPAEIYFQRAQAASDMYEYTRALKYYQEFLDNEPGQTHDETFSARYEIAFIHLKIGEVLQAKTDFESIMADFNDLDKSSGVSSWIRILSQRKLQDIQDKLAKMKPQT